MAIGWLSVLKMVPWGDVVSNAPRIADSAKKLWSAVARERSAAEGPLGRVQSTPSSDTQSIAKLQAQLAATLVEVSDLHTQMLESTELIKALADQNTELIKRVEVNRIRVLWLAGIGVVLGVVSVISLALTLAG